MQVLCEIMKPENHFLESFTFLHLVYDAHANVLLNIFLYPQEAYKELYSQRAVRATQCKNSITKGSNIYQSGLYRLWTDL